jgi:hypothetical protein
MNDKKKGRGKFKSIVHEQNRELQCEEAVAIEDE